MSATYYRVRKDTFLWKAGAIIAKQTKVNGYEPIEDVWDQTPVNGAEYISANIIEHPDNADFFERVYKDDLSGKIFRTKDQIIAAYDSAFKK